MTDQRNLLGYSFGIIASVLAGINPEKILSISLSVLSAVSIILSISFSLYRWYKLAKADGKLDKQEIDELADIIKDSTDKLTDLSKKGGITNGGTDPRDNNE